MTQLINGRGQMGSMLKCYFEINEINTNAVVYHTWNIEDKSEEQQKQEYKNFQTFVDNNIDEKIIFISTSSQKESFYVKYKQLAECYLIEKVAKALVLRFPTLIGKGVFQDFKQERATPYGFMNIMSLSEACNIIISNIDYDGVLKIKSFQGHTIEAKLVYEMVRL